MAKQWRVAGVDFSHMHMGDLLRSVADHPAAEIVGVCDREAEAMGAAVAALAIPADRVFTDWRECLERASPDLVILCPPTAEHADWVERVAPSGAHVFVEKPFAASVADADRMIAAVEATGKELIVNWPLRWEPAHYTAWRLIDGGTIGDVLEVHHYGGNRGPLYHAADKVELEPTAEDKAQSWWYRRDAGGGSLRDYLGYGVTIGTWFNGGRTPLEVTSTTWATPGLEVDEHSVTVARYEQGLSKFETRWGTYTDPWVHQPQPKCGFVVRGTDGTISSYDYEPTVRVQTRDHPEGRDHPVEQLPEGERNAVEYTLTRLGAGLPIEGPLSPAVSRIGQQILDAAVLSSDQRRTVKLEEVDGRLAL